MWRMVCCFSDARPENGDDTLSTALDVCRLLRLVRTISPQSQDLLAYRRRSCDTHVHALSILSPPDASQMLATGYAAL